MRQNRQEQSRGRSGRVHRPGKKWIFALLAVLFVSGCVTVGPDYVPPEIRKPAQWIAGADEKAGGGSDPQSLAQWWSVLNDPLLTDLVERAVRGNLDLKQAEARIREARARRGIARANQFPTLDATGSAQLRRSSASTGTGKESDFFSLGFDSAWELDLFGGIRRSVEAADADIDARIESFRDVMVSLTAEVAFNYVEVRSFQTRLSIALAHQDAQAETHEIVRARFNAGLTSLLDVEQADFNLQQTRSQIPALRSGLEQAKNRLSVLLGESPGHLSKMLSVTKPIPVSSIQVVLGIPAETLRRRPDVRAVERALAAQSARVGVATADLYPRFTLLGSIGLESFSSGSLFQSDSRAFLLGPSLHWPIFNAGAIRRNIAVQTALQEQALIAYEATVLRVLQEVENALIAYGEEQLRRASLVKASDAAARAVDLATDRYQSGLEAFQTVLDSQRSLLSLQDQLAASEGEVTSNLIRLYKALGGGWMPMSGTG